MSLLYIIDGYNIINHPAFSSGQARGKIPPESLLKLIKFKRLCGKNKAVVVFDGFPPADFQEESGIETVFSRHESADDKIKRILDSYGKTKNIVVVSNDNEVKFFAKSCGAKPLDTDEFLRTQEKMKKARADQEEAKLSYSQIEEINRELRKKWLK